MESTLTVGGHPVWRLMVNEYVDGLDPSSHTVRYKRRVRWWQVRDTGAWASIRIGKGWCWVRVDEVTVEALEALDVTMLMEEA